MTTLAIPEWDVPSGRHALIEDAVHTPIFLQLTRGDRAVPARRPTGPPGSTRWPSSSVTR